MDFGLSREEKISLLAAVGDVARALGDDESAREARECVEIMEARSARGTIDGCPADSASKRSTPQPDPLLKGDARALIVVDGGEDDGEPIAAFRSERSAHAAVGMREHALMLGDLLAQMAGTIQDLEARLVWKENTVDGLKRERQTLYDVLNERKAQARRMAASAIESLVADDPDDEELRERLERMLARFDAAS